VSGHFILFEWYCSIHSGKLYGIHSAKLMLIWDDSLSSSAYLLSHFVVYMSGNNYKKDTSNRFLVDSLYNGPWELFPRTCLLSVFNLLRLECWKA
jgi:hypothetical protein